jgi:hypothetical protein
LSGFGVASMVVRFDGVVVVGGAEVVTWWWVAVSWLLVLRWGGGGGWMLWAGVLWWWGAEMLMWWCLDLAPPMCDWRRVWLVFYDTWFPDCFQICWDLQDSFLFWYFHWCSAFIRCLCFVALILSVFVRLVQRPNF